MTLTEAILSGDRRALARLITQIDNDHPDARPTLASLFPHGGKAHLIGVTGAPGTGKSTLVTEMAKTYRSGGQTVAILAVDPSSPFTGGAILGDRIRMRDLSGDNGVFIRSMATRGSLGGLARTTAEAASALDSAGFDVVLIETVGAGQSEVEIAQLAQTTVVIEAPNLGDDVQAIKAGILEIADVLAVNKVDLPGADSTVRALRGMLGLAHSANPSHLTGQGWAVPVCETIAAEGKGIGDLLAAIERHRRYLIDSGEHDHRRRARARRQIELLLREQLMARYIKQRGDGDIELAVGQVAARERDPYSAVEDLLK